MVTVMTGLAARELPCLDEVMLLKVAVLVHTNTHAKHGRVVLMRC